MCVLANNQLQVVEGWATSVQNLAPSPIKWWPKSLQLDILFDGIHCDSGRRLHVVRQELAPCIIQGAFVITHSLFLQICREFNFTVKGGFAI